MIRLLIFVAIIVALPLRAMAQGAVVCDTAQEMSRLLFINDRDRSASLEVVISQVNFEVSKSNACSQVRLHAWHETANANPFTWMVSFRGTLEIYPIEITSIEVEGRPIAIKPLQQYVFRFVPTG